MNKRKMIITICGVVAVLLTIIGITYAYWGKYYAQSDTNVTLSGCINVSYQPVSNALNMVNAEPQKDVDGIKNTAYSFTITNNCVNNYADYDIALEMLADATDRLEADYVKVNLSIGNADGNNTGILANFASGTPVTEGYDESYVLGSGILGYNESVTYSLRMWIDWDSTIVQSASKALTTKVVVKAIPSKGYKCGQYNIASLADCVIAKAANETTVSAAKNAIKAKTTPNFANIDPIITYQETNETKTGASVLSSTVQVKSGAGYTFDSSTGFYTLTGDITTGNYEVGKFTCNSASSTSGIDCRTIYEITGVNATTTNGDGATVYSANALIQRSFQIFAVNNANSGMYATEDDYGDTFYFRGDITNNYVKYAGYYWRIVRVNGDGSVRMIYQGTTANGNGQITGSAFNSNRDDNAYVGYMYGEVGADNYADTHANTHSSTIKGVIDQWYIDHIRDTEYASYLSDTIFCGDRSSSTNSSEAPGATNTGGYGTIGTYYGAYYRNYRLREPSLKCKYKNDRYTVDDETNGNGALTYPIALLTSDDVALAGATYYPTMNQRYYLYTGNYWWTTSPYCFLGSGAREWNVYSLGSANIPWVTDGYGVRPVINLKSDILITEGDGTKLYPYEVKTLTS